MSPTTRLGRVDQKALAERLKLSQATVSRALSGAAGVRPAIRQRVEAAARKYGYRPDLLARSLRGRRSHAIGLITDDITAPIAGRIARGVEAAAHDDGLAILFSNTADDLEREERQLEALRERRVDGVIFAGTWRRRRLRPPPMGDLRDLPHVFVNSIVPGFRCILSDDAGGQRAATAYLLSLGHRRIALINGPDGRAAESHLRGYEAALAEAGLAVRAEYLVVADLRETGGHDAVRRLLALRAPPTAITCANDAMALGALDALREAGWRVPDDMSVVGFDDREFADYLRPPLTTVALPLEAMGREALRQLVEQIERAADASDGGHTSKGTTPTARAEVVTEIPCALVPRGSTGPPRSRTRL